MQTAYSLPENTAFYQRYATLAPILSKLGIFAQTINALCEFGIVHALLLGHIAAFFGPFAFTFALVGAAFAVFILEMGQRAFLPYAARAVLYRRFAGLDLVMTVAIFACSLALFSTSLYLAFKGSRDLVEHMAPPPVLLNEKDADATEQRAKIEAQNVWRLDSAEIAGRYAVLIQSETAAAAAQIAAHQREVTNLQNKAQNRGQSYNTLIKAQGDKIAALRATLAAQTARLQADAAAEIRAAKERKASAEGKAEQGRDAVTAKNGAAEAAARAKVEGYGAGLGWFTVIFHFVLLLAVALQEVHRKGAGIELRATPNQYHFSQSVWAKFMGMVADKWNYHARAWIDRLADRTPPPTQPKRPHPLFDAPAMILRQTDAGQTVQTEPATNGQTAQPGNAPNGATVDAEVLAWARQQKANGRAHNLSVTEAAHKTAPAPVRDNAMGYDWDALHNGGPIVKTVAVDPSLKPCKHCQTLFRPRTTWQVYCNAACKLADHEAKHGARFDPAKAKFKKAGTNS